MPIASGANSVASALGNRPRRDPGAAVRTYHEGLKPALKTGTFYLAGNRNFLFGPDIRVARAERAMVQRAPPYPSAPSRVVHTTPAS